MRVKQILWVLAAFVLVSLPCAQARGPQTESVTSVMTKIQMAAQSQGQDDRRDPHRANGPAGMTRKEVMTMIKNNPAETVIKFVKELGVDFDMTPRIEKKLRKAKATDEVLEAVRRAGPKVRAQSVHKSQR